MGLLVPDVLLHPTIGVVMELVQRRSEAGLLAQLHPYFHILFGSQLQQTPIFGFAEESHIHSLTVVVVRLSAPVPFARLEHHLKPTVFGQLGQLVGSAHDRTLEVQIHLIGFFKFTQISQLVLGRNSRHGVEHIEVLFGVVRFNVGPRLGRRGTLGGTGRRGVWNLLGLLLSKHFAHSGQSVRIRDCSLRSHARRRRLVRVQRQRRLNRSNSRSPRLSQLLAGRGQRFLRGLFLFLGSREGHKVQPFIVYARGR